MLSTNVVSAKAASPSGPGSATFQLPGARASSVRPPVGSLRVLVAVPPLPPLPVSARMALSFPLLCAGPCRRVNAPDIPCTRFRRVACASSFARPDGGRVRPPRRPRRAPQAPAPGAAARLGRRAGAAALPDLLLGGPWPRLAGLPGGRRAVGPAAEQQQGHRAEPERLDDRERSQDGQHDQRAADDAEHT